MFIRNTWYVAAEPQELAGGKVLARTLLGEPVVLCRTESGRLVALEDRCPHRFVPLSIGKVVGETLRCAYHGACFDASGACVQVPGQDIVPEKARIRSYPVVEKFGYIWIWPGDPALATDLSTIPDFLFRSDHPDWRGGYGLFESIKAGYQLINDNLIDITHAEFVHPESFGCEELQLYRNPVPGTEYVDNCMTFTSGPRNLRFRMRSVRVTSEAPFYRWMLSKGIGVDWYTDPIDFDMEVDWAAPGFTSFLLNSRRVGEPREKGFGVCNMHLLTPETEHTSHYFYRSVMDFGDEALVEEFMNGVRRIFAQDQPVLEAQQARVGRKDLFEQRPVSFAGDMLQLKVRRIIQDLLAAEKG